MEHMRFAVTVDPIPHNSMPTPPLESSSQTPQIPPPSAEPAENDAYGVPASFAPVRNPASRSHDPTNNQKRTDPFAFGSRYLEEGDNIFEFNAWDHVTVDSTYQAFSEEQYSKQRAEPVSDFDRKRYNEQPEKWWNQFYKNNKTNFFKNRKWLAQEFPILEEVGNEDAPAAVVLEVGAGAGNSAFPILQRSRNKKLKMHACDFSKKAVELIRNHELYNPDVIQADVWDVAASPDSDNGGLPPGLTEGSVDVVLMIFIFSALSPKQWDQAVRNVWRVLKPGGQVLFRDYGRGDLAQVRFKKGRYMEENFYVRGWDEGLFLRGGGVGGDLGWEGRDTQVGNVAAADMDTTTTANENAGTNDSTAISDKLSDLDLHAPPPEASPFQQQQQSSVVPEKSNDDVENPHTPRPVFEVAHIGVDRRMLVNRQRRLKMYRCWMQAVFRKAGEESEVRTSTLRVDKEGRRRGRARTKTYGTTVPHTLALFSLVRQLPGHSDTPNIDLTSKYLMAKRHATSFFDLPRELRDIIYHFLWHEHEGIAVPYFGQRARMDYLETTSAAVKRLHYYCRKYPLPKWLCISKMFHKEVIDAFNERAEWREAPRRRGHKDPIASSALFNPSTARIVTFHLGDLAPTTRFYRKRTESIAQNAHSYMEEMSRFADSMMTSSRPQEVHLCFDLAEEAHYDTFQDLANIDVEYLETFQHVAVRGVVIYVYDEQDIKRMNAERQKNLYEGFARMARAIFGCEHVGITDEQCWGEIPTLERWIQFKKTTHSE
ncbi:hypothetical protein N0V83_005243 [Neocucurbitaria cava]|uniref:Methyltransferase type 12 domain-containing protein n=1 Tax=Neocucurbitaria cava TaxID=798079 RepID=A0A9W9CM05_9PLEO|nr:hypothetical protein N0V83_005243 [Neocucurbitaria cava]